ncbi:hypothetical protein MPL3356_310046 [Mesorhizobium plurifarium]|uniref:Uncharacterized protein n=1 Tax=Mesorhizobium plurifarium TaxID=69974 RepID=A0A090DTL0_MESPL|nr:hypothetical protein MPL3356_310046 [Mesorhizobium plurifarium]
MTTSKIERQTRGICLVVFVKLLPKRLDYLCPANYREVRHSRMHSINRLISQKESPLSESEQCLGPYRASVLGCD